MGSYEGELIEARQNALCELETIAMKMGVNAVAGIGIDYEVLDSANNMLMFTALGTAAVVG